VTTSGSFDSARPGRALPARPDLRFLKDEAKRRKDAGEFGSLGEAQLALAREHGFASWPRFKAFVETRRLDTAQRAAALVKAACSNDVRKAVALLRAEPGLATFDLWTACACGEAEAVERHLARDPAAASRKGGPLDWEPILYACFSRFLRADAARAAGIVRTVALLLDRGADPNVYYMDPEYKVAQHPIYAAAGIANNPELTKLLFDGGAVVDDPAKTFKDPTHPACEVVYHAAEFRDPTCLRMVLEHKPPKAAIDYCLARATDYENPESVRAFLEFGADPNFPVCWKGRRTQAHKAVVAGRGAGIMKLLLDAGADANAVDEYGVSILRSAVRYGQEETVKLLEERGADTSVVTDDDRAVGDLMRGRVAHKTAALIEPGMLAEAAQRNDVRAIDLLLDAGAHIHAHGGMEGMSPLHWACWRGNFEAAQKLVERGADIHHKNQYGGDALRTTIHGSCNCFDEGGGGMKLPEEVPERGYAKIAEMLIGRGAKLPEVAGGSDAVRAVLVRNGVPEEEERL
jgi:ankyrin repeat protein